MLKNKKQRLAVAIALLTLSATLLSTASYAWFAMNTKAGADDFNVEAYSDSLFLQISKTNSDDAFNAANSSVDFTTSTNTQLRLVTNKTVNAASDKVYSGAFTAASSYYLGEATKYYKRADSDVQTGVYNYVDITSTLTPASDLTGKYENLVFGAMQSGNGDGTSIYYTKDKNIYNPVTPANGESLKGKYAMYQPATGNYVTGVKYYTKGDNDVFTEVAASVAVVGSPIADNTYKRITDGTPAAIASGQYGGGTTQYWESASGSFFAASDLYRGDLLDAYYTAGASLTEVTALATAEFDGTSVYYIKSGNDYVCLGTPAADTAIDGYAYWGRAYSDSLASADSDATLNVLPSSDSSNTDYYLAQTFYIRQGEGTGNAENLKVSKVSVKGATNSLTKAIRVLIIAESSFGDVAVARYNNRTGAITHEQNGGANLFDLLLGDEAEVITVRAYIYFDGTDADAYNNNLGILNGQSVSIEFSIDEHDYNEVN